jgi:hypothetical protein
MNISVVTFQKTFPGNPSIKCSLAAVDSLRPHHLVKGEWLKDTIVSKKSRNDTRRCRRGK